MSKNSSSDSAVVFMTREVGTSLNRVVAAMDRRQGFKQPGKQDYERVSRLLERISRTGERICFHNGAPLPHAYLKTLEGQGADRVRGNRYHDSPAVFKRQDAGQRFGSSEGNEDGSSEGGFTPPSGPAQPGPARFDRHGSDNAGMF